MREFYLNQMGYDLLRLIRSADLTTRARISTDCGFSMEMDVPKNSLGQETRENEEILHCELVCSVDRG